MSRLIDADALKDKAFGGRKGLVHSSDIDAAPTIDAIPVEWLNHIQTECVCDMVQVPLYVAIGWLVDMWQKEQEADIAGKLGIEPKEGT